ncbi:MAG: CoA pyrophosphatase, partial [Ottowia sp.]|nr:CoA pyrophosphatase [Ottowia sp.]
VLGTDAVLPAVPAEMLTAQALRQRFAAPPAWQPEVHAEPSLLRGSLPPAAAAVLLALLPRPQDLSVLLTERTQQLSSHAGQVAFPGGRMDAGDASAADAALREAQEEVGLERRFVEVIGQLPVYLTGTRFAVTPVVALVQEGFALRHNPQEGASVFDVPLAFLMNPAHHRRHSIIFDGQAREWFSMPYDDGRAGGAQRFIWGATAGMLRNFYRFLSAPMR